MIVTMYTKDGTKERRPVGYAGGLCNEATKPYEAREIKGQVRKTPTGEACLDPVPTESVIEEVAQR